MSVRSLALALLALTAACSAEERRPAAADPACFGSRVLSFQDLVAEVVIPPGEGCVHGTFQVVFTRGADTLATLTETRHGTVGFLGTSDVNGDGRGEFFIATMAIDPSHTGALFGYTDTGGMIGRLTLAPLDSAQSVGYVGRDRFGFGGADQLVRAFPRGGADTAWFGYSHGEARWVTIPRPSWLR
ncbi:MAG: hypothetical protein WD771_09890 [Gemmatimonadaceae bacterium]